MNKDKERLQGMLEAKKISEADYKILVEAVDKKSFFSKFQSFPLINPFRKIAGFKALALGLLVLVAMSFLGVIAKVYFIGVMGVLNATAVVKQTVELNFFFLLYQNAVSWLVLSSVFYIATKLLHKQSVRLIDFFGTVALARLPLLILTLIMSLIRVFNPDFLAVDFTQGIAMKSSLSLTMFSGVIVLLWVWQVATYYSALKESSGLVGKKLWLGFITSLILAEVIIQPLATLFMD